VAGGVKVLLFGAAAERAGGIRQTEVAVVEEGTTIGELWDALTELYPGLEPMRDTLAFAVNGEYARMEETVFAGDEVAVLPPVSGG
jgi:molybdopterin converting factor subunit 1